MFEGFEIKRQKILFPNKRKGIQEKRYKTLIFSGIPVSSSFFSSSFKSRTGLYTVKTIQVQI
jgi:hypothetical protein